MAYLDNEDFKNGHVARSSRVLRAEIQVTGPRSGSYHRDKTAKADGTNLQYFRVSRATGRDIQCESFPRAFTMMWISEAKYKSQRRQYNEIKIRNVQTCAKAHDKI